MSYNLVKRERERERERYFMLKKSCGIDNSVSKQRVIREGYLGNYGLLWVIRGYNDLFWTWSHSNRHEGIPISQQ